MWKEIRRSVLRSLHLIQTELYHGGSRADYDEDHTQHSHTPFRIKPHPKLESLASNLLVRSCLLIVLCMGAFWYCVTMMDQQQQHLGGSNRWADLGSETAVPTSIAMTSSSLGTTTSGSTASLGVDTGSDPISSPPTPQEANSAQDARPEPASQQEDSSLSFLSAGIITAFIRSTAAAMAEYSPLSTSSNSGSASTTPILARPNAFLSSFQGSRASLVENGSQSLAPNDHEQDSRKGRDDAEHVLDHTSNDPETRKENTDRNPNHSCRDYFDRAGPDESDVEMERGESSRTSSRRSSIMGIKQEGDSRTVALATPASPTDLSPFQTHFYNMDALASVLFLLISGIHAVRAQPGTHSDHPLRICSQRTSSPQAKEMA
ncbi:hypothetical protein BG000_011032 [Podila horticola]|nr:hypothetical protein BG000_011032 [Podila horticola]